MTAAMPCAIRSIAPSAALMELLAACKLPVADISASGPAQFFGAFSGDTLVGAVGLEPHGQVALLRSLAVTPALRGSGLGKALVAFAEQQAAAHGGAMLYLLTTTAEPFFSAIGYAAAFRADAPAAIQATAQFSGLCPAAATLMSKRLP